MTEARATMRGNPGDSARKRGLRRILVPMLVFGILFGFAAGVLLGGTQVLPWWTGLLMFLVAFANLFFFKFYHSSLVYGYFKGARGEEMVASELARLPASWTIFNGLILPDGRDADHVAVGPQGVFVIETKHWFGSVSIDSGKLLANGRPLSKSPIAQVRTLSAAVQQCLPPASNSVRGILCFAGPQFQSSPQQLDEVAICSYLDLADQLSSAPATLDTVKIAAIVALLCTLSVTKGL